MPTSTAMGMVTLKVLGMVKRKISITLVHVELLPNHHLKDVGKVAHEQNEGENHAPDERVRENLAENVAGQDAHGKALKLVYRVGSPTRGTGCQRRRRRLFASTLTELSAMAAAATHGLRRIWNAG